MSTDRAADVLKAMVAMFATGDLTDVEATVHPNYVDHQGVGDGPVQGVEGFASVVAAARRSYRTLQVTVEDLIVNSDRVAARLRWSGLQQSGHLTERETLEIVRIENDKAVEHWGGHS